MIGEKRVTAIILVAGNSTRYGKNRNKNLEEINGQAVLMYSLKEFEKNKYIDDIIIAIRKCDEEKIKEIIGKEKLIKNIQIVLGGKTRAESTYNCIKSTKADIVIIHDGARPMIKQEYINKCIENIGEIKGVTIGVKSKDTIKITDENNIVINTTQRSNTWIIQTPQCFDRKILLNMYEKYKECQDITDDCQILEKGKYDIMIIDGDYTNIKITTYEDLEIAKKFLINRD